MKKVALSLLCLTISIAAVNAQDAKKIPPPPPPHEMPPPAPPQGPIDENAGKFQFNVETHDFGSIPEGPKVEYDFEFTNSGKKPITISNAKGSCGCTVPEWPHDPILPGKKSKIHVTFSSQGRPGKINKSVIIYSNAQQQIETLYITGEVIPKAPEKTAEQPKK